MNTSKTNLTAYTLLWKIRRFNLELMSTRKEPVQTSNRDSHFLNRIFINARASKRLPAMHRACNGTEP